MNNLQENRLSMYLAVRDFLLQYPDLTKDLPNYNLHFTGLQNSISEIQSIAEIQKSDTKGYAKQKQSLRDKLITLTLDTSHKMNAFAKFSDNLMLQSEVKMTRSRLIRATDTGLRDFAQIIYAKAEANLEALKGYGVTSETQTEFIDTINKYNSSLSGPRVAKTETVQATKQLTLLFEKADLMLENIDAVIGIIKYSQSNFVNGFITAKKIVNAGTGSLALKATAVDTRSGTTIKGVRFVFKSDKVLSATDTASEFVKTTADKGSFIIKNLLQGTYTVTVSKPGYSDKVVSVVVADGEMTELRVELERA
jgi:hypothetical protein